MKTTTTTETEPHSLQQARAQLSSIKELVAALTIEGAARLKADSLTEDELREILLKTEDITPDADEDLDSLRDIYVDAVRERIQEDALEIQVRGDWHTPGDEDGATPSEFYILLCTGGPACRIRGELRDGEPHRAWLEHQDWGTAWQELPTYGEDNEAILTYARQFYFGDR